MTVTVVAMAGPLPPIVGGMASVIDALSSSSLGTQVELRLVQTGKTTPEGRSLLQGLRARVGVMRRWWACLAGSPPAVAHIHTCSGLTYFLDGLLVVLARLRGAPVVLHVHGGRFDVFLDGLGPLRRRAARWFASRAHLIVVLSSEWQQRLSVRLPAARMVVVPNGVPSSGSAPAPLPQAAQAARFVFLGALGRGKGIDVLIDAAASSELPWRVELAGPEGEPGFAEWARQRVDDLGLQQRVRLLGPVVGEAKAALLASAHAFVLPSRAEGLPMAMLEAMAAGLPVVATPFGAIPEVIREGVEGCLVSTGDAASLSAAMDRLAADPCAARKMGEAARRTCQDRFGVERMVQALWGAYELLPAPYGSRREVERA